MLVKKELIGKLKEFGLNSYEAKLWIGLLSRGVSTAGELSDISEVPRSRAYDVLESLEKKGFIIVKLGKPIKYLAVPPKEVVERVKRKVQDEAQKRSEALDELRDSNLLGELNTLHHKGIELVDPTDKSGAFRGREKIYEHMSSMIKSAEKSVTLSTTAEGLQRKARFLRNDLKKAKARGITIKIAAPANTTNKAEIKELSQYGEVRSNQQPSRFLLVDDENMLLMLQHDKDVHESYDSGVWFSAPLFVAKFGLMFDQAWDGMRKI